MTQIIGTITQDYILLAADRRLTFVSGPHKGQLAEDDECKLVSLCNICGISYTGWARIENAPTHEWIATRPAEKACVEPGIAAEILKDEANRALGNTSLPIEQSFLFVAWGLLAHDLKTPVPYFQLVTNARDEAGNPITPGSEFVALHCELREGQDLCTMVIGQPLTPDQFKKLDRYLRRLVKREISPNEAMLALVREIGSTAKSTQTIGPKILCLYIPRVAAERLPISGRVPPMVAQEPDRKLASFCYFDPIHSDLLQYGPTFTCGEIATTLVTEKDPQRKTQSSSVKFVHVPAPKTK
jgi:hypothetical protein